MIHYLYLGRMGYCEALGIQEELIALRQQGCIENTLLLLEHPPVLTLGRNANRSNVLAPEEVLAARGVTVHEINRGGDVTYHGPGQLIGYPIFDLRSLRNANGGRLGPVDFVRRMEEALIRLCAVYGVEAGRICGLTGVWIRSPRIIAMNAAHGEPLSKPLGGSCAPHEGENSAQPEAKIAAIGIHVSRGVTSHGFAFNVTTDLDDFKLINPCGITDRPVTSLKCEMAREAEHTEKLPALEAIADDAARQFGIVFEEQILALENLAALRALAGRSPANAAESAPAQSAAHSSPGSGFAAPESPAVNFPAPEFPAADTPLQIPSELEQLRHRKIPPVNA